MKNYWKLCATLIDTWISGEKMRELGGWWSKRMWLFVDFNKNSFVLIKIVCLATYFHFPLI